MAYSRGYQNYTSIWVIIIANLMFFIASLVLPQVYNLALLPATVLREPWTIVTSVFLHANFGHIFANMLTFFFFGTFLIQLVGERNFLYVYFIGGILGSIFYIILTFLGAALSLGSLGSPLVPVVGASGAVYALGGALTVLVPRLRVFVFLIPIPLPLWVVVIIGFLLVAPGVAWQAHLGGLLFGLLTGLYFRRRKRDYTVY